MGRFYYEDAREPWREDGILGRFLPPPGGNAAARHGLHRDSKLENRQSGKQIPRLPRPFSKVPAKQSKRSAGKSGVARDDKRKALDLGMGYGRNALWLAEQGYSVEGWERDGRYISEAKGEAERRGVATCTVQRATKIETRKSKLGTGGKLVVRQGDFIRGDWRGPYDVIVISQALHQLKRSEALRVLARAKRALAPGGRFFLLAKLTSDRHVQRVRRDPAWKPVAGERNTFERLMRSPHPLPGLLPTRSPEGAGAARLKPCPPERRRRGHYHPGRPRTPQMVLSALTPGEIRRALAGLRVRHWRTVVLRSDWEEEVQVTHTVAEVVAEKRL